MEGWAWVSLMDESHPAWRQGSKQHCPSPTPPPLSKMESSNLPYINSGRTGPITNGGSDYMDRGEGGSRM